MRLPIPPSGPVLQHSRGGAAALLVVHPLVNGMGPRHPVQKQEAVDVVYLVLNRSRLESVGFQAHFFPRPRQEAADMEATGPTHISGEVGDRHAPLSSPILARRADHGGIHEYEAAVTGSGLGVAADVETEHLRRYSDLVGSQSNTSR